MKSIKVCINSDDAPESCLYHPQFYKNWVMGKLKEAGVPVVGTTVMRISHGTLTTWDSFCPGDVYYCWEGDLP